MFPKLTKEEIDSLKRQNRIYFKKYKINHMPLYRKISMSLQTLAVKKLLGGKRVAAIKHHFKACIYYPEIGLHCPSFRKQAGLPI
jgi:hypothetical protein